MPSKSIHVAANGNILFFFFMAGEYSIVHMYTTSSLYMYLLMDVNKYLGMFHMPYLGNCK